MRRALGLAPLLVSVLASAALAAPVATLAQDVDGDQAVDQVELDATGALRIGGAHHAQLPLGTPGGLPLSAASKLRAGLAAGTPTLVAELATSSAHEAVILELRGGTWRTVARSPIGGVGLDEEYAYAIDVTSAGVVRYQSAPGITRCDGQPAYLFAEQLVAGAFVRMPRPPAAIATPARAATPLPAVVETGAPPDAPLIYKARAASTQAGVADASSLGNPNELDDGRLDRPWREDLAGSAGEGQFFTFRSRTSAAQPGQLRIVPGARAAKGTPQANRPHELLITTPTTTYAVTLPDPIAGTAPGAVAYTVDFPAAAAAESCVTVILGSTYGAPTGDTAIAELALYAAGERSGGGAALLASAVAAGGDGAMMAAGALAKQRAAAVPAIEAALARTTDANARKRLVGVLVRVDDPAAAAALVHAVDEGWAGAAELTDIVGALARTGQTAALQQLITSKHLTTALRVEAVAGLVPTGPGFDALVALAGRGPAPLRRAVIERLRLAPASSLLPAAAAQTRATAVGDLYRAVTRRGHFAEAERAEAVSAMLAALPDAADYERRYRLVDGVAELGDAPALHTLQDYLVGLAPGAETTALREVAVRGVGIAPRPEGAALVLAGMTDPDPGVRLAALFALGSADASASLGTPAGPWHAAGGTDEIDRVIINGLQDHWPEVRRRAASVLGSRCSRPGPAGALVAAVGADDSLDVRRDALSALVQCHAAGIATLLATTWDNEKLPTELRAHAVQQAIALGDPALAVMLVARFERWRGQAIESAGALQLAQTAAAAIGKLGPPGAVAALLPALDDTAFPEIVTSAALGLGSLGAACPSAVKAKLTAVAHAEPRAAAAAAHAAAQCTGP